MDWMNNDEGARSVRDAWWCYDTESYLSVEARGMVENAPPSRLTGSFVIAAERVRHDLVHRH